MCMIVSYVADVPDVSYSTSEDEDFYDACEEECHSPTGVDRNPNSLQFSSMYQRYFFVFLYSIVYNRSARAISINYKVCQLCSEKLQKNFWSTCGLM